MKCVHQGGRPKAAEGELPKPSSPYDTWHICSDTTQQSNASGHAQNSHRSAEVWGMEVQRNWAETGQHGAKLPEGKGDPRVRGLRLIELNKDHRKNP